MAKLKDRLLYGDLQPALAGQVEDEDSVDGDYGVGKRGDEVVISLGAIPPFQVPKGHGDQACRAVVEAGRLSSGG